MSYAISGALAALLSYFELVSRYRDRPAQLLRAGSTLFYMLFNAAVAMSALYLLRVYDWTPNVGSPEQVVVTQTLIAGLGSMLIMRSTLVHLQRGDRDIAIGPESLMRFAMEAAERGVNRFQTKCRIKTLTKTMEHVVFERAREILPVCTLGLMEGVDEEKQRRLAKDVVTIETTYTSSRARSISLGHCLLKVTGVDVLKRAVVSLGDDISDRRTQQDRRKMSATGPDIDVRDFAYDGTNNRRTKPDRRRTPAAESGSGTT